MLTYYNRAKRLEYIKNLLVQTNPAFPAFEYIALVCLNLGERIFETIPNSRELRNLPHKEICEIKEGLLSSIETTLKELRRSKTSKTKKNIELCASYFGLSQTEKDVFEYTFHKARDNRLNRVLQEYYEEAGLSSTEACAISLGLPISRVRKTLSPESRLLKHKLIQGHFFSSTINFMVPDRLMHALDQPAKTINEIRTSVLGSSVDPRLDWEDFAHMDDMKDIALKLLNSAVKNKEKGINILLYGSPGTGKTEFCKTLAAKAGLNLYAVTDVDEEDDAANSRERLEDLMLKQQWMPDHEHTAILFDEMEDIGLGKIGFRSFSNATNIGGKAYFNRLLEENPAPVLWTCNDAWWFDESFIRRMSLVIELKAPRAQHMKTLLEKVAHQNGYNVDNNTAEEIAGYESISPGVFVNALRVTKLAQGNEETLKSGVKSIIKAMNGGMPIKSNTINSGYEFRQDISNTDISLEELSHSLAGCESKGFSLCLHGAPGTGKSAYARYLAKNLGMDVLFKRGSDILSPFVGMTERNIAAVFEEAKETESFLIIDEADSFLQDRSGAHRSWEVTEVNEVLTWLECHPLPVAFTTNFFESLDSASLRRFTFKVKFGYLDKEQAAKAFEFFFGITPPDDLERLDLLTPGDFANVRKKTQIMGLDGNRDIICKMLTEECELKPEHKNPIGFGV